MNATETDCDVPCAGDSTEMCGAPSRINLYQSGATPPLPPTMVDVSLSGVWNLLGCYKYAFYMPCFSGNGSVTVLCTETATRIP